jgi:hypothetical protein
VLPGGGEDARAPAAAQAPVKPGERRITAADEIARIEIDIARLQGACIAPKH